MAENSAESDTFGGRIAVARRAAGLTQQDLASRLGVEKSSVSRWETDEQEPRKKVRAAIADHLGVRLAWLQSGAPPMQASAQAAERHAVQAERRAPTESRVDRDDGGDRARAVLEVFQDSELDVPREHLAVLEELVQDLAALRGLPQLVTMLRRSYLGWLQEERGKLPAAHQRRQQEQEDAARAELEQRQKELEERGIVVQRRPVPKKPRRDDDEPEPPRGKGPKR